MNQLIVNPKRYVLNYLGMKNSSDLEIALEIYLADKVFNPKFLNGSSSENIEKTFNRVLDMYVEINPEGLSQFYYFNFLDFAVDSGSVEKDLFDEFSVYTAENILRKAKLRSTVANNILKTNDFYKEVHRSKLEVIEDEDARDKVMGLIMLHNKELYKLGSSRMVKLDEYRVFEIYKGDFINAEESILVKSSVL